MCWRHKDRRSRIREKILERVDFVQSEAGTCWVWTGPTSGDGRGGGYPRMCLDGATVAVHRASFVNAYGIIPPKKQIDHRCGNRACVNPEHLELVTHRQNQRRKEKR